MKQSIKEIIQQEKEEQSKGELFQKQKFAFALQNRIRKLNGYYVKQRENIQFKIYTPKNTGGTLHFLKDGTTILRKPQIENPQKMQGIYTHYLREIEKDLIKAHIGYMPYLQH